MALFYQKGTISDFSEVQSGTTQSGKEWQRMTLILDTPGFQGAVYKMVFQVSGDHVKDVLLFNRGDKVEIGFSMYAREWNGKWYNNVDLYKIESTEEKAQQPVAPSAPSAPAYPQNPQPRVRGRQQTTPLVPPGHNEPQPDDLPW